MILRETILASNTLKFLDKIANSYYKFDDSDIMQQIFNIKLAIIKKLIPKETEILIGRFKGYKKKLQILI